jgi:DNA invertase Pin-like site-specific DNA recombinase
MVLIMSKKVGYARVSSKGQQRDGNSLESQEAKLLEAGADYVKPECFTGTTMERPVFSEVIESLEPGDTLMVCKLDRFARTAGDGSKLVKDLIARGIKVHILNMGLIEDSSTGRLILNILLSFAEFERDMIVERLNDGKEVEKANNPDYREGRKPMVIPTGFDDYKNRVSEGELSVVAACKELGISRSLWYKWVKEVA